MSKIATIIDGIHAKIAEILPTKTRIPNPYELSANIAGTLANGYGIVIGSEDSQAFDQHTFGMNSTIDVIVTKELFATDSDAEKASDVSKELLEDIYAIRKRFLAVDLMELPVNDVKMGSRGSIEQVVSGNKKFLSVRVTFNIEYHEDL